MKNNISQIALLFLFLFLLFSCQTEKRKIRKQVKLEQKNPLPSWSESTSKQTIIDYVVSVTDQENKSYIEPEDRIAVFDNDGTLSAEKPFYFQYQFIADRLRYLSPAHPEWRKDTLLNAVIENDLETVTQYGDPGLIKVVLLTHTEMTVSKFEDHVRDWLNKTYHPKTGYSYTEMIYQPMIEMIRYLKANKFKVFIVTGAGIDFLRTFGENIYDIPPYQMVGSHLVTTYENAKSGPVLIRKPGVNFVNNYEGKPVGIDRFIGKKPVIAFGNSDADIQMFEWTKSSKHKSLTVYIHHTDSVREWAYDKNSFVGRLDKGLKLAKDNKWTVVDMEKDWDVIFPTDLK